MIIITAEKTITTTWLLEYLGLVDLDERDLHETIFVKNLAGIHLLCFSVGALRQVKLNHQAAVRIANTYEQRRALIAQQLAAGGNPS